MSESDAEKRRAVVRAIVTVFIEHPDWTNVRVARETGFIVEDVDEVRVFALSFPPIDGVKPEPTGPGSE